MFGGRGGGRGGRGGRQPGHGGRGRGGRSNTGGGRGQGRGQGRGRGSEGSRGGRAGGRGGGGAAPYRPPHLPANPSDVQFIRSVLKSCPNQKLNETLQHMEKSWLRCWQGVDKLPRDALTLLLSAVARLPYSASLLPPPLPACSQAVTALLTQIKQHGGADGGEALDGNDETLEGAELVERLVRRLLKFTWDLKKEDVKDALDDMIAEADASLNIRSKMHRPVRGRLTELLTEMDKPWIIKVKTRETAEIAQTTTRADWRHPTVGWLSEYKNFQPALLPKLQLPRTNEGRVYQSSAEYFQTIVKLWIGMTFIEGNNALLPHCTVKMGDKVCDQPLWPYMAKDAQPMCRNPQCDRRATFLCAHRMHNKGYCTVCADKLQQLLRGPPSTRASTHIYDGTITSVKYDGIIGIEHFQSRRPPLKPIHWRTTKRLSSPNLIGIVLLANREASLRPEDELYWAEVTFQGKSFDEFKARERGCLTLRLLDYLDQPGNAMLERNPTPGGAVALIDCQTFVPEFIPVLKALESQQQMPVPFQDGALLNLNNAAVGFAIDRDAGGFDEDDGGNNGADVLAQTEYTSTHALIRNVVRLSLLDPIIDIRRDRGLRDQLELSLLDLVSNATLDPGQLKSFTEALMYPVHCTQGPPGTGKSYLGVVIVRALLIVRDLWIKKNRDIGEPPILVLSYKNHAIDEFLLDLLRAEPKLDHNPTPYFGKYYLQNGFKKLVRIGGGCSEPDLEQYRERNVANADPSVCEVSQEIESCQELRDNWHKFRDCFSPIYEAQTTLSGISGALNDDIRKVVQRAVPAVSSAMATILELTEIMQKLDGESKESSSDEGSASIALGDIVNPSNTDLEHSVEASLKAVEVVLKRKPMIRNVDIVDLHVGIKHYDPEIDPQEVLYQWVTGFHPLPACTYAIEPCSNVCADGSKFCGEHSCKFPLNEERCCLDGIVRKRLYCKRHLCSAEKCKSCRVVTNTHYQLFCEDHACFLCLSRDELAGLAEDVPPRNSCERHPLCWGMDGMCVEVAELNTSYCKMHAEELYCTWKSQYGISCRKIASTGQYCGKHYSEMEALLAQKAGKSPTKCQSLTRKGKPCKGKPIAGSGYCVNHMSNNRETKRQLPELPLSERRVNSEAKADKKETPEFGAETDPKIDDQQEVVSSSELVEEMVAVSDLSKTDHSTMEVQVETEDIWSSDSDNEDTVDTVVVTGNEDEIEESEHLQHLREVYEVNDEDEEDLPVSVEDEDDEEEKNPWSASDRQLVLPHQWHWEMSLEERWSAILSVLELWSGINSRLKEAFTKTIEQLKLDLHCEVLRANARVYEGKAVVGGTITGCVARLEAIRTTNPFAILVEEASEVMEPLLFSCFGSSTRKLEMIGDHMQLQPSVMGRIDFERLNRINISMFERLICAPRGNEVPSSVLSIQRRMRKNICDLTRTFYTDITIIEDHDVCGEKVIGGKSRNQVPLLKSCEGGGREVPGVLPHIFFWTHTGAEQRAAVGLSRVNTHEAHMVCKLVQYLVHCGVPPTSIAVLTPYKGQLMLMRKLLMDTYGLRMMTKGRDPRPAPQCTVSTVDRFQGDEADIVIISLVIDGKSRTPFVKLQNRMIVLLSRARLGMYIVGNKEYFGETTHWQKTLGLLEQAAEPDTTTAIECTPYAGIRIGSELPICCPEHRKCVTRAKGEKDLKLGFCTVVCSVELPCSHNCGLMCHWPSVTTHNKTCNVEVESPCNRHPRVLKCSAVTASTRTKSIGEALSKYECDVSMEVSLPCGHNRKMKCHTHKEIEAKRAPWPVCNKVAVAPYVYPECKHLLKCSCCDFDRYTKGRAPPCDEKVEFTPPCKHIVSLSCQDRQDYMTQARKFTCKEKVRMTLPRCGHETLIACPIAGKLSDWHGSPCPTLGLVQEGQTYGPKDYICKQLVKFERRCGHHEMVKCERAFELSQNPSRCLEKVVITNPECGHECSTTCFEKDQILNKIQLKSNLLQCHDVDPLETVREGDRSNFRSYGLNIQCTKEVNYVRACGHEVKMKCIDARHTTSVCDELVTMKLPTCGHSVRLPCYLCLHLSSWQPWKESSQSIQLLLSDSVVVDSLEVPRARPLALRSVLHDCMSPVRFCRTTSCGHDTEMRCSDAFKILQGKQTLSPCTVRVLKKLDCGHEVTMECSKELGGMQCQMSVEKPCWNFTACGTKVEVPCRASASTVHCNKETEWFCSAGHSFFLRICSRGVPSDCPVCSMDRLEAELQTTQRSLDAKQIVLPVLETFRGLKDIDGVTHITVSASSTQDFVIRKMKLLQRFKEGVDPDAAWANTLFSLMEIPVFVPLSRKLQSSFTDRLDIAKFGGVKTLNGIEVYEATQENFTNIVKGGITAVVFGHLYTAKHLVNPADIPKGGGKKGFTNIRNWVARQSSHSYDALYREVKSGKGGSWIVWQPYTIFPVHRVDLTESNRLAVLQCLPETSQVTLSPQGIRFEKPSGMTSLNDEKHPAPPQASSVVPIQELDKLRELAGSVSPIFDKMNVWHPWDGKTLFTGASDAIPKRMEKTLASKLNFIPSGVVGTKETAKTPFGGTKYVQSLQSQGKLKDEGKLFWAMEMLAVRKEDASEAMLKLEDYVKQVCTDNSGYAHPLVIVAIARLAIRSSRNATSEVHLRLLVIFGALYPEAIDWLSDAERRLVQSSAAGLSSAVGSVMTSSNTVEDKWKSLKGQFGCRSDAMEELLKLVGLKKVKQAAVNLFKNAMTLQQLSAVQRKKNMMAFNYCFVGNPGTGKTTVARLFARVMKDSQIRRASTFVECTAQQLKDNGADEFRLKLKNAMGGVLFIDEAYELDPIGDFKGKPIVAELLTAAEDKRDDLSIILAGYEDDIQKKLYAYNDGLPSRFTEVVFEDFDAQDLEVIWDGMAQDRGWEYEKPIAKVACRRLAKAAGRKGFGNARAVRKLFEQAVKEAMAREDFDWGNLKFETVDLLGDRPSINPKLQAVLNEVEEKTGWNKIKDELKKLVRISDENYERELKGQETVPLCLNRLFLGNPGTGKTTCAEYYGRVLKALHFLSNGEVVKKTAGDFVGSHVGESQTKTSQILEMAKGKVLVIDEAYNLNDNMYGKQVLDVLVEKVQGTESDDLAVLLIGYEREMLEMLRTQNPGLMRRFPPQYAFYFEDYTEHELLDILEWNCAKRNVSCPYEVAEALLKQLALQKTRPNFGNAGAVEQLVKHALGKAVSRPMVGDMTVLTLADVGVDTEVEGAEKNDPLKLLDKLYRMNDIREQLSRLRNEMEVAEREGSALPEAGHFVFRGSPGTGKTTVARVMAQILHDMGVLATTKLIETSGLDLTAQYVGQTKQKVTEKLGEAKGGLLFIDEAYELGKGTFGEEAMTTLVAAMTDPSYVGMVIIIAGYPKDMDQMLDRNAGLKSRFARFIDFPDWEAQDAVIFLSSKAEEENFELEGEAVESLQETFTALKTLDNFGNGRDAMRVWKELLQCRAQRVVNAPEEERTITGEDAEKAGENVLVARRGSGVAGKGVAGDDDPLKLLDDLYRMDKIRDQLLRLQVEMAVAEREGTTKPEIGHFVFRGSPGTGKTTVARVMAQILYAMGALATTKLVETSGNDLTGEYLGQTKIKVTEKLVEAKGGLLFIDEAYDLGKGHFGEEAMTTLVAAMTDPAYTGMVIVIAGYPADMNVMLNRNAGLKSRFTRFIDFPDWEAEDGVAFLQTKAAKEDIELDTGVEQLLHQAFVELKKLEGFGNGRDAVRVWKELLQCRAQRVFSVSEEVRTIALKDAKMAIENVLAARRPPDGPVLSQSSLATDTSMFKTQQQQPQPPKPADEMVQNQEPEQTSFQQQEEENELFAAVVEELGDDEPEQDTDVEEDVETTKEERDPGVPDEDWEELERAKEAHAAHLAALRRARDQAKLEEERRRAEALQEKIRRICPCPAGFQWYKSGAGWRCGGGSHFVSDAQLNSQFTC